MTGTLRNLLKQVGREPMTASSQSVTVSPRSKRIGTSPAAAHHTPAPGRVEAPGSPQDDDGGMRLCEPLRWGGKRIEWAIQDSNSCAKRRKTGDSESRGAASGAVAGDRTHTDPKDAKPRPDPLYLNRKAARHNHRHGLLTGAYHMVIQQGLGKLVAGVSADIQETAMIYVIDTVERMKPHDPIEEMLVT